MLESFYADKGQVRILIRGGFGAGARVRAFILPLLSPTTAVPGAAGMDRNRRPHLE